MTTLFKTPCTGVQEPTTSWKAMAGELAMVLADFYNDDHLIGNALEYQVAAAKKALQKFAEMKGEK